jgi:hypothetical protein
MIRGTSMTILPRDQNDMGGDNWEAGGQLEG